jgi:exodeoxyribonuclease VII large subunit
MVRVRGALTAVAPRRLARRRRDRLELGGRIARAARAELRRLDEKCSGLARVAHELSPERVLARGFSITRTEAGQLVRGVGQAPAGERIVTRLASGTLRSRVETSEEDASA